jgi:RNA polymerase sigma-70 factor (TIGR02960 family)
VNAELANEFSEQAGRFRRELLTFCYRMLGSAEDAEDAVQETYLNAWRSYDTFEGRSSLRTWLYRIAARACLKALERGRHRPLPSGLGGPSRDPDGPMEAAWQETTWLQPFPSDPASVVEDRATMRLALVAALQHLPPRQRVVLILRDVLQWRAAEVGELLDMSATAVNSALQRARAQLPLLPDDAAEPAEPERRAMLDKYVTAFETADVTGLAAVLTEDASWEMPPIPTWFAGRDTVVGFLASRQRIVGGMPAIPAAANGQPAFAFYARDTDGAYHPHALHVLTLTKAGISRIVSFQDPGLFPLFGLPPAVSG